MLNFINCIPDTVALQKHSPPNVLLGLLYYSATTKNVCVIVICCAFERFSIPYHKYMCFPYYCRSKDCEIYIDSVLIQ